MSDLQGNTASGLTRGNYADGPVAPQAANEQIRLPMRAFTVQPLDHGYVIQVGCNSFAIESKERLIEKLAAYITDPAGTEMKWQNKTLFS
jgi:hypothetical protein